MSGFAIKTASKIDTMFNLVENVLEPVLLRQVDANAISLIVKSMREAGRPETTINGYLAHLRSSLGWAKTMGMISAVPDFPKLARAKKTSASTPMKGRPITAEEFERKLVKVESVVGINTTATTEKKTNELVLRNQEIVESWKFFLNGLWWSGLRLEESLGLRWDHSEDQMHVDFTGKRPMLSVRRTREGPSGPSDAVDPGVCRVLVIGAGR